MALNLFEVVKYEGSAAHFAWKYENPNVKLGTTVIVGPNQIAFWVSNGVLASVIGPGKHKINGNYLQGLSWVTSQFTGGQVPSSGEIWFISTGLRSVPWGTPSRISMNVNYFNSFRTTASIGANGNLQLQLGTDAERIWEFVKDCFELYGENNRSVSVEGMGRYVQDTLLEAFQAGLNELFQAVELGNHYAQLPSLSHAIAEKFINPELEPFGVGLRGFQIKSLEADPATMQKLETWWNSLTEADIAKYQAMRAAEAERYGIEQAGFGTAASRQAQGYTFQEERQFEVLQTGAGNAGVGGDFLSAGVGLAMGGQMGNVMGGMFVQAATDAQQAREQQPDGPPPATAGIVVANATPSSTAPPQSGSATIAEPGTTKFCINCGATIPAAAKFCPECGEAQ